MNKIIGFIGCGNIAQAMIGGIIDSGLIKADRIFISNRSIEKLNKIEKKYNVNISLDNKYVAEKADILILSIKPYKYNQVIKEIKNSIKMDALIISIAAGITQRDVELKFDDKFKIVRVMPNISVLVGEGMSVICSNDKLSNTENIELKNIFSCFGRVEVLDEKFIDGIIALSGSSPAYVFIFIEAMADAAVKMGIPRDKAYTMAAQSVLGAAKMVLETQMHPGQLKDMVCSPGGTTIEAVVYLEDKGFRTSVINAMVACAQKSEDMSK